MRQEDENRRGGKDDGLRVGGVDDVGLPEEVRMECIGRRLVIPFHWRGSTERERVRESERVQ